MVREKKTVDRYFTDTRQQWKTSIKKNQKEKQYIPERIIGEEHFYYYVKWKDSNEINYEPKKRCRKDIALRQLYFEWNRNIKNNPFFSIIYLLENNIIV
jgi:hypothetical protein